MSRVSLILAAGLAVISCGGAKPQPQPPQPAQPQPQATTRTIADLVPMCQRLFARKQTCADDYLPVLLDLRVELNLPPGIGDTVKSEGRDAILARAHTELARDTRPEKVNPLCEEAAEHAKQSPAEQVDELLAHGARCEAATDCRAFSACVVEIDRTFIRTGPKHR